MSIAGTSPRRWATVHYAAIATLVILFVWVYGRFAFGLYFAMDDFINSTREMTGPLGKSLVGSFTGELSWSGYRPLTIAMRVLMAHAFGLQHMWGYYLIYLGMHLVNTLLTFRIAHRVSRNVAWAFFAAAVVLLLPSQNEAVFWFAANANVLALLFALLTLDFALTSMSRPSLGWQLAAAAAYICAVLAYEVTIVLPFLIFLAEWALMGRPHGKRLRLYSLLVLATVALLGERLLVQGSVLGPSRADYAVSLDPATLIHGYLLIAGQMILLFTSPFPGQPDFQYERNWLIPSGWIAVVTIAFTLALSVGVFVLALRAKAAERAMTDASDTASSTPSVAYLFWIVWGLLWIVTVGVAFAGLTGRNPENRYTYMLGFGMSVSLTSLLAWLHNAFRSRRALQYSLLGLSAGLLSFYAYVSVGDATDWATAGQITRSVQMTIADAIPALGDDQTIAQIGVPAHVGTALTYTTKEAFSAAMSLQYGTGQPALSGVDGLRKWLNESPDNASRTFVFVHDSVEGTTVPLVNAVLCTTSENCTAHKLARPDGTGLNSGLRYVDLYNTAEPQLGGLIFLATLKPYVGRACYFYGDYGVPLDPNALEIYPYDQRCSDAIAAFWDNSH